MKLTTFFEFHNYNVYRDW